MLAGAQGEACWRLRRNSLLKTFWSVLLGQQGSFSGLLRAESLCLLYFMLKPPSASVAPPSLVGGRQGCSNFQPCASTSARSTVEENNRMLLAHGPAHTVPRARSAAAASSGRSTLVLVWRDGVNKGGGRCHTWNNLCKGPGVTPNLVTGKTVKGQYGSSNAGLWCRRSMETAPLLLSLASQ